jgi:heptosyltransferase-1
MGDILHALPAVSALRVAHPEWVIGWAVEPQWGALFVADSSGAHAPRGPAQPLVDMLHLVPAKQWARQALHPATLRSILRTRSEIRKAGYDAALDLQGAVRSAAIARWAAPARLLGEAAPREPAARWLFRERIPSAGVHVIEQAADVVRALNGDALPLALPLLPCDPEAAQWCESAGVGADFGPSVLLHPGAGWGAKRWPVERYAQAGASIARQTGCRIVINVAPSEGGIGIALAAHLRVLGVTPLLLSPTVGQLIELTRRITLAIGGDTGPLHLAAALGKSTVGIFGPTDPARNGPFHGQFRVLRDPVSRRDHTRRSGPEAGLLRITPESVAEAAVLLLRGDSYSTPASQAQGGSL